MQGAVSFAGPALVKEPPFGRIGKILSNSPKRSSGDGAGEFPECAHFGGREVCNPASRRDSALPEDFVGHPIADSGKACLEEKGGFDGELAVAGEELAHERFAKAGIGGGAGNSDPPVRPPSGGGYLELDAAKLAGVGEDEDVFWQADGQMVMFGGSERVLPDWHRAQFAGHPKVNAEPCGGAELEEHLFAAGPGLAVGQAGEGADEVFGVCASKDAGVWMEVDSHHALAASRVPLFAVILDFSQLRHAASTAQEIGWDGSRWLGRFDVSANFGDMRFIAGAKENKYANKREHGGWVTVCAACGEDEGI